MNDEAKYGPAMRALPNDRWRAAAEHYAASFGGGNRNDKGFSAALRAAGYEQEDAALRVTASRMFKDARMQAAVIEITQADIAVAGPAMRQIIHDIAESAGHPMQFAAAKTILDRAVPFVQQHEHRVEIDMTVDTARLKRVAILAKRLGVSVEKLVGWREAQHVPIDVEFEEAPALSPAFAAMLAKE